MAQRQKVPAEINIYFKRSRGSCLFYSPDVPGLLVSHTDLETAFGIVGEMVSAIISEQYHENRCYEPNITFDEFSKSLNDGDLSYSADSKHIIIDDDLLHPAFIAKIRNVADFAHG